MRKLFNKLFNKNVLSVLPLLAISAYVLAQGPPTPVQQVGSRADASIQVATTATTATTLTLSPPNGQSVYIMGADIQNCGDATGVTAAATTSITTTNLGGLSWLMGSGSGTGACLIFPSPNFGPGGLKSATPGTAVTFVTPTFATHQTIRLNVYYQYAQ